MAIRTISNAGGNFNDTGTWVEGIVPVAGDDVVATATSGNLTVNVASGGVGLLSFNMTSYTGLLTMDNTLTISGNMTLVATMNIAGSSNIICNATATLTSGGKVLPGLSLAGTARTYTLADNFQVGAFINTASTTSVTLNGNTLSVSGNMTISRTFAGTTNIVYNTSTTQTINITGVGTCSLPTQTFNATGTITISGYGASGGTLTYTAGTVVTTGSTLAISLATTLNTNGIVWNNITFTGLNQTMTLLSDLYANGTVTLQGTNTQIINGSTIFCNSNLTVNGIAQSGTTAIVLTGTGTWSSAFTSRVLRNNLTINTSGTITISGTINYNTGTLTYTTGKVITTGSTLAISLASTLINMDKIAWNIVTVTAGVTLTMNKFFSGSPNQKTTIQSATSGTAYTITFQDTFEKIAKFVKVSDCSLTRRGQLLMLTPNSNKGGNGNLGIRYINQSPNGIAKNSPTVADPITYPAAGLVADPCFILL
jgi:hypothetical protein